MMSRWYKNLLSTTYKSYLFPLLALLPSSTHRQLQVLSCSSKQYPIFVTIKKINFLRWKSYVHLKNWPFKLNITSWTFNEKYWQGASSIKIKSSWAYWILEPSWGGSSFWNSDLFQQIFFRYEFPLVSVFFVKVAEKDESLSWPGVDCPASKKLHCNYFNGKFYFENPADMMVWHCKVFLSGKKVKNGDYWEF